MLRFAANWEKNASFSGVMRRTGRRMRRFAELCRERGKYAAFRWLLCLEERHSPKLKLVYIFVQHNCSVDSLKC